MMLFPLQVVFSWTNKLYSLTPDRTIRKKTVGPLYALDESSKPEVKVNEAGAGGTDSTVQKSQTQAKRAAKKEKDEFAYWLNTTDPSNFVLGDSNKIRSLRLKIRGNPRSLVRHRTGRGIMYNPSAGLQNSFRKAVCESFDGVGGVELPLFQEADALSLTLIFRMKRAKNHFVAGKPGPGRLKENAPKATAPIRNDIDNLVKFVLDTMNQVLYPDDRQITSIHVVRLLDDEEPYAGSTELFLRTIQEEDLEHIMNNSFDITQP